MVVLLLVASSQCTACADEPTKQEQTGVTVNSIDISNLISELDSPSRRTRVGAERRLIEIGEPVLSEVMAARPSSSFAIRDSLRRIQQAVETQAAKLSLLGTRMNFASDDSSWTVQQALQAIAEQSRTSIELHAPDSITNENVKVEGERVLFWTAFQQICTAADVGWKWTSDRAIEVSPQIPRQPGTATVWNCFRINAAPVSRRKTFTNPNSRRTLRVKLRLDVEDSIHPFYVMVNDADLSLKVDSGELQAFSPQARREIPFAGQSTEFSIDFQRDSNLRLAAGVLRGQVQVRCAARREALSFPLDVEQETVRFSGQTEVKMQRTTRTPQGWEVALKVIWPPDVTWESHRLGLLHREVSLMNGAGEKIPFQELELTNQAGRTHEIHYQFPSLEQPLTDWKFVYVAPALFATVDVPFEMKLNSLGD